MENKRNNKKKQSSFLRKLLLCVPALCVIAVVATFYMIFDMNKKIEEKNYNVDNINNESENNISNDENSADNENTNSGNASNSTANNNSTNNNSSNNSKNTSTSVSENKEPVGNLTDSTDKKEQAINLVKKNWGDDNTVLFDCYVNSNDEYIVTVSSTSGKVISYYKVDLEKGQIDLY